MSRKSANPIPDLCGQGCPRPEPLIPPCRHTGRNTGECRGLRKPEAGASQPSQGPTGQRTGTGGRRSQFLIHHESEPINGSRIRRVPSRRCGRPVAIHPPDLRLGEWDGGNQDVLRPPETLGVRYRRNATGGKSGLTVAATKAGDGSKAPDPFNVRLVNVRLNGPLLHSSRMRDSSRMREWKRPSPARGAALRMFFAGGSGPARSAPPVRPRPSRFPRPRVPRTERALSNLAQPAAGKPSTNARPKEMPMKQHEPE